MRDDGELDELRRLADLEAIRTVLFRYARGIDRRDPDLVRDCYHIDAIEEHGTFAGPAHEFVDFVMPRLNRFAVTSHNLCNMWVEVKGAVAVAETYFIAFHLLSTERSANSSDLLMAGRYIDRFEKREHRWRIAHRQLVCDYTRLRDPAEALDSPLGLSRMMRPASAPLDFVYSRWHELDAGSLNVNRVSA